MALLPQNPRDQKLVILIVVSLAIAGLYQQYVWSDENAKLDRLEVRLDTLDSLNAEIKREVAKGSAAKLKKEAEEFGRELSVLQRLVPTSNEVPALLEQISSAARRAGLEFNDVQPDGIVNGEQFDTYKYKVGVKGPYHQVAAFLANIGSLPRIVAPINVSLAPLAGGTEHLKPKKNEKLLDVRFGIQTYVAHAPPPPPAAAKPGAP